MKNKNIVIVIKDLKIGGGAERQASVLGNELKKKGYNVSFLVFVEAKEKFETEAPCFCLPEIKIKNSFDAFLAIFKRAKKIKEFCREKKIDCVISFMEEANFASIISKIFFNNKAKLILSIRENPNFKKFKAKVLIKLFYNQADRVVVNARANAQILAEKFKIKNTKIIYNLFNFEEIRILANKEISSLDKYLFFKKPVFVNIGRLNIAKGQEFLIRAFSQVLKISPEAKLIILGEGELKNRLNKLIKEIGLENNIFLLGNKINPFPYLIKSDCFVLSSVWEGLPNTLIEALAVGSPAISTDCQTGPREIIAPGLEFDKKIDYPYYGKRGILVNESSLGQAMVDFVQKGDFGKKEHNLEEFEAENVIKEWVSLIEN